MSTKDEKYYKGYADSVAALICNTLDDDTLKVYVIEAIVGDIQKLSTKKSRTKDVVLASLLTEKMQEANK